MVTKILMGTDLDEKEIEAIARADDKVAAKIEGKTIRKVIVVKNRLVNIVAT
jgi:leucyl-tRNA synthetase